MKRIRREYWPAKEWRIVYALQVADEALPALLATVTLDRRADASARPGPPRLIEFFPADAELPSLAAASDAERMAPALDRLAAERGRPQGSRVTDVQVMRYRPHRQCVLRYTVVLPDEDPGVLIGKIYPGRQAAANAHERLANLRHQTASLVFPEPVGFLEEWNLVLMTPVAGTDARVLLKAASGESEAAEIVRRIAEGLAVFHALPVEGEPQATLAASLESVRQRLAVVHALSPQLAPRIGAILDQVASSDEESNVLPVLTHGEYSPSHLFLDGEHLALVDLDTAQPGDPALDVGNFSAALKRHVLLSGRAHLGRMPEAFLAGYQAHRAADGLARRAQLFEALSLVRMVLERFERMPYSFAREGPAWRPLVLLDEAASGLAKL